MCHPAGHHGSCYTGEFFPHHGRSFLTKEERLERLEKYREHLEKELQGLREYIEEQNR
jgi:hypothetical protein